MKYICLLFFILNACSSNEAQISIQKDLNKKTLVNAIKEMHDHFSLACNEEDFLRESDLSNIVRSLDIKDIRIALIGADKDLCAAKIKITSNWSNELTPFTRPLIVNLPLDASSRSLLGL